MGKHVECQVVPIDVAQNTDSKEATVPDVKIPGDPSEMSFLSESISD
jgi:hypothetical protein